MRVVIKLVSRLSLNYVHALGHTCGRDEACVTQIDEMREEHPCDRLVGEMNTHTGSKL